MKKILIAFDGTQFSKGALEFAIKLNELSPILLTAVFVPQLSYASLWNYSGAMAGPVFVPMIEEEEEELLYKNIELFEDLCRKNGISYRIHQDYNDFALPELKNETRFADLMIVSSEKFFEDLVGVNPEVYMREALHESECPVVIVPENYEFPEKNILAYDGTSSSVYAIKQFAYLFPELAKNETLLVFSRDDEEMSIPREQFIEELVTQHYHQLQLEKLDIHPKKFFETWISEKKGVILVSGSFGRSGISEMLRKSFARRVIAQHKIPVFIAHR